mgnify:CR=1 FL=1
MSRNFRNNTGPAKQDPEFLQEIIEPLVKCYQKIDEMEKTLELLSGAPYFKYFRQRVEDIKRQFTPIYFSNQEKQIKELFEKYKSSISVVVISNFLLILI